MAKKAKKQVQRISKVKKAAAAKKGWLVRRKRYGKSGSPKRRGSR